MDLVSLEDEARERLPREVYDFFAGGAGDEETLRDNVEAWGRWRLRPRVLRDVSLVDPSTTVLECPVASPVGVAPAAFQRLAHADGECATASACGAAGALMVLSTRSTATPDEVVAAAPDLRWWFQVYVLRDRGRTEALVEAAIAAGCRALVLTGDTPVVGTRARPSVAALRLPDGVTAASDVLAEGADPILVEQDPSVTFGAVGWLAERFGLPVVVKGVLRGDDAVACLDAGAAAVWVSNHGGRQLDGCVATADALPEVVAAVGERGEVYVDGGVRRGVDVVRALALGARAAFVARPVLWGLAVAGAEGVRRVLDALTRDVALALTLSGAPTTTDVTPDMVQRADRSR